MLSCSLGAIALFTVLIKQFETIHVKKSNSVQKPLNFNLYLLSLVSVKKKKVK